MRDKSAEMDRVQALLKVSTNITCLTILILPSQKDLWEVRELIFEFFFLYRGIRNKMWGKFKNLHVSIGFRFILIQG